MTTLYVVWFKFKIRPGKKIKKCALTVCNIAKNRKKNGLLIPKNNLCINELILFEKLTRNTRLNLKMNEFYEAVM